MGKAASLKHQWTTELFLKTPFNFGVTLHKPDHFPSSENRDNIVTFARAQLDCTSPKTRKAAKAFLDKWEV